jgi:hypothetical protein
MAVPRSPIVGPSTSHTPENPHEDSDLDSVNDEGNRDEPITVNDQDLRRLLLRVTQALDEARAEIRQQAEVIATLQDTQQHAPGGGVVREPRVNEPAEFGGKASEYRTFMSQCLLTFTLCPITYNKDKKKVLFVISYLVGTARDWACEILENEKHPYYKNFPAFKQALDTLYLDRNLKHQARDKLSRLKQTKSAAAYSVEFQETIAPLKLNDDAKCLLFYMGLKDTVKDALATIGEEETFQPLVDQVIAIDQRQHQRRMEEKKSSTRSYESTRSHESTGSHESTRSREPSPRPQFNPNGKRPAPHEPPSKPRPHSQPRGPISEDEKNRRRDENLCFRCASPDHKANDCHLRKLTANASTHETPAIEYTMPRFPQENWPSQVTMRQVS